MKYLKFYLLSSLIVIIACQSQQKKEMAETEKRQGVSMSKDILKINIDQLKLETFKDKDLYENTLSDISEYLPVFKSDNVNSYSIGSVLLNTDYNYKGKKLPSGNHISFVMNNETTSFIGVEVVLNYLGDENSVYEALSKIMGTPQLLNSKESSINSMKQRKNWFWENYSNNHSLIISQFSEKTIGGLTSTDGSEKIHTVLFYFFKTDAKILYPNGQIEDVKKRLVKRFSR
ncbi:hypothetical protein GCM10022393_01990 [Aquimarina addita]|uniref:Uncharacterized protein n=1 Tax=Aquimarina addita TaxID=870485 RepID=A0ABP7X8A9_9FLAO